MKIDIVITTYNRPVRAGETVQQLLDLKERFFQRVILVDSSDDLTRANFPDAPELVYLRSSHKNQPSQRFLGYIASDADVLLYLDDDMDLLDPIRLISEMQRFNDSLIVGINFSFRNDNAFLAAAPRTVTAEMKGVAGRLIKRLSGSPDIAENRFWRCGLRGKRVGGQWIEFVQGGAFAARRTALYKEFNFQLFDLFEVKLGMGEDAIIGYTLSKQGVLWAANGEFFHHNDQKDSTYTPDILSFSRRVAFSRLFLSLEYARLNRFSLLVARLHYHWYMLWRSVALLFSLLIKPTQKKRWTSALGWISGWGMAFRWRPRSMREAEQYWCTEAAEDLQHAAL